MFQVVVELKLDTVCQKGHNQGVVDVTADHCGHVTVHATQTGLAAGQKFLTHHALHQYRFQSEASICSDAL